MRWERVRQLEALATWNFVIISHDVYEGAKENKKKKLLSLLADGKRLTSAMHTTLDEILKRKINVENEREFILFHDVICYIFLLLSVIDLFHIFQSIQLTISLSFVRRSAQCPILFNNPSQAPFSYLYTIYIFLLL